MELIMMLMKTNGNVNSNVQKTEKKKTLTVYAKQTLMNMYIPLLTVLTCLWDQNMYHIVNVILDSDNHILVKVDVNHVMLQKFPTMDGVVVQL